MNDDEKFPDLFGFLKCILGCAYISDLRTEPYNIKAKLILEKLDLKKYPNNQVMDIFGYIYGENNNFISTFK
jgi:hypothetical protein